MGWIAASVGHEKFDGEQDATGRSQLFGDGRVQWRSIPVKFEENIPSDPAKSIGPLTGGDYLQNEWNGPGSGWVNTWDVCWY
ncbi:MAG: hypothetical protein ACYTFK_04250 [Planctomycetota bacterium]